MKDTPNDIINITAIAAFEYGYKISQSVTDEIENCTADGSDTDIIPGYVVVY